MIGPLNTLVFGGCLVRRPLRALPGIEQKLTWSQFGDIRTVHSFGEMFQILDILKGQADVSAEMRPLTGIGPRLGPLKDQSLLESIDVALIELGSPVDIRFRGVVINRARIQTLLKPVETMSKEGFKLCQKWIRVGLVGGNEKIREELANEIEAICPPDGYTELRRAVLQEARAENSDLEDGFRRMQELLRCPLGAVVFIFRYMPDGRPIVWPAGTREEVTGAAGALGIPVFEPVAMVQQYGVARALAKDGRHYTPEFLPVIGEAIVRFAQDVHAEGK